MNKQCRFCLKNVKDEFFIEINEDISHKFLDFTQSELIDLSHHQSIICKLCLSFFESAYLLKNQLLENQRKYVEQYNNSNILDPKIKEESINISDHSDTDSVQTNFSGTALKINDVRSIDATPDLLDELVEPELNLIPQEKPAKVKKIKNSFKIDNPLYQGPNFPNEIKYIKCFSCNTCGKKHLIRNEAFKCHPQSTNGFTIVAESSLALKKLNKTPVFYDSKMLVNIENAKDNTNGPKMSVEDSTDFSLFESHVQNTSTQTEDAKTFFNRKNKKYQCGECKKFYISKFTLRQHYLLKHSNGRYRCTFESCQKIFYYEHKCKEHILRCHPQVATFAEFIQYIN